VRFRIDAFARAIALCRSLGNSERAQELAEGLEREHGAHPAARAVLGPP
jgi:hypothetical protein